MSTATASQTSLGIGTQGSTRAPEVAVVRSAAVSTAEMEEGVGYMEVSQRGSEDTGDLANRIPRPVNSTP